MLSLGAAARTAPQQEGLLACQQHSSSLRHQPRVQSQCLKEEALRRRLLPKLISLILL